MSINLCFETSGYSMQTADNNNKVLSKLGHREDIKRRKELSSIALSNNEIVWKTK